MCHKCNPNCAGCGVKIFTYDFSREAPVYVQASSHWDFCSMQCLDKWSAKYSKKAKK